MRRHIVNVDEMAEALKLPSWDTLDEMNLQYYWEAAKGADEGLEGEAAEEALHAAEDEARTELFQKWHSAVVAVYEKLLDEHQLQMAPRYTGKRRRSEYPFEWVVRPKTTWQAAANALRETVNGVGMFHFSTLREFLSSGPYTAREAALGHLHWMKDWFAVYGAGSASGAYESAMR
jgi:hypothetical protein